VATDLTRIGEKARKEPGLVFTSLYHHICDVDNLRACYDTLEANKATGVDGVTKEEYGKNLEENLRDLSGRLRRMGYRPGPKRRSYIPKAGTIFVSPMIFWPASSTKLRRRVSESGLRIAWRVLDSSWRKKRPASSNSDDLPGNTRRSEVKSRRSLPFWALNTTEPVS